MTTITYFYENLTNLFPSGIQFTKRGTTHFYIHTYTGHDRLLHWSWVGCEGGIGDSCRARMGRGDELFHICDHCLLLWIDFHLSMMFSFHFTIYHGTMTFCYDRHTLSALHCAAPPAAAALTLSYFDVLYLGYPSENLMCLNFFLQPFLSICHTQFTQCMTKCEIEDSESEDYL